MLQEKELYIGIDLGYERAMVSLYHAEMKEVETVSTVLGEERYQIPQAMFVGKQGNCFYGEEALRREQHTDGEFFERLYAESLQETAGHLYRDCLAQFIQRLIRLRERFDFSEWPFLLSVTVPEITPQAVEVFSYVRKKLNLSEDRFLLTYYAESFFAHTFHQEPSIWVHNVALFDFSEDKITFYMLQRGGFQKKQRVRAVRKDWQVPRAVLEQYEMRDVYFSNILREAFEKQIVSGVYLIGDGFDGSWLGESLRILGPNKRVFLGKNLYTRGACYAALRTRHTQDWNFVYDCAYKMQGSVSMKAVRAGETVLLPLVEAGTNWFWADRSFRIIYNGDPNLKLCIQKNGARSQEVQNCLLSDLPDRPDKTIRLLVRVRPQSGSRILLEIRDDGFGALFPGSDRSWKFYVSLEGGQ